MAVLSVSWAIPTPAITQAADPLSDPDAYAVYAAALPRRFRSPALTILQNTHSSDDACITADDAVEPEWMPVSESYRQENARGRVLQEGFDLGVPYSIVPMTTLRKLMQDAGHDLSTWSGQQSTGGEVFARFPGGRLVTLSAVGFNAQKTRAIVTVQADCFPWASGLSCKQGDRLKMKKENGAWAIAGRTCGWIA